jgi:predicted RNA-binding protein
MAYFLDISSPETYEAFKHSTQEVSAFRLRHKNAAERVHTGDKLLCYLTKLSRWFGVLEVLNGPYLDDSPIFYPEADPFVIKFKVRPLVVFDTNKSIPIYENGVWDSCRLQKITKKVHRPGPERSGLA